MVGVLGLVVICRVTTFAGTRCAFVLIVDMTLFTLCGFVFSHKFKELVVIQLGRLPRILTMTGRTLLGVVKSGMIGNFGPVIISLMTVDTLLRHFLGWVLLVTLFAQ